MIWLGLFAGLLAYAVVTLWRSCFRVDQGHLAVLTTFGKAVADGADPKKLRTFGPGLHWKLPWQHVVDVPVMEQNLDLSGEQGGRTAMAEDGTVLRFDSILRYRPIEAELGQFLFHMKAPLEHITGLFTCLLRNEIANFRTVAPSGNGSKPHAIEEEVGSYAVIRRDRKLLNKNIEEFCRTQIGKRYGVQFSAVDLTEIVPPDELADSLNAVMNAQSEADEAYHRAEADCQRRVLASERGVEIARARSQAAEEEILTLGRFLEELAAKGTLREYVRRRRAEVLSQSRALFTRTAAAARSAS